MYDLIGDIHGSATELEILREKRDYNCSSAGYRYESRQVIFLRDFVDRGLPWPPNRLPPAAKSSGNPHPNVASEPSQASLLAALLWRNSRGLRRDKSIPVVGPLHRGHSNPQTDIWIWSGLHGITAHMVQSAPTFAAALPVLDAALAEGIVYQHSGLDRSAIAAACTNASMPMPPWQWRDSVHVARSAWPELRRNGGHGLANLKARLGLEFNHHDAGEDARAAAEVVLNLFPPCGPKAVS